MKTMHTVLAGMLLAGSTSALAINEGFETGNVFGFGVTEPPGSSAEVVTSHTGDTTTYQPVRGKYFLVLKTDGPDRFTTAEQQYRLQAGDKLAGYAAFDAHERSTDPTYNDHAEVRILSATRDVLATPFAADVASVGATGDGPWRRWTYTAPADGTYILEYRIINVGDDAFDSYALFDGDELKIDIKPGSASNDFDPASSSYLPVVIFGSRSFDVGNIDRDSIRFGDLGIETSGPSVYRDVNGDGRTDILAAFRISRTGLSCVSGYGFITARLISRQYVSGSDTVHPINCD